MSTAVVKTGLYWLTKSSLTEVQLKRLRHGYSYYNPKDPEALPFETFIETDDKFGVPTGDFQKLLNIVPDCVVEDRTVVPKFSTKLESKGLTLRDYQEVAMQEITEYFGNGGTCFNLAGSCGCVDCDTEFLTRTGWKRIADYTKGDEVLQWEPDGSTKWVSDVEYVKEPCDTMTRVKTTTTDMVLSDEHRVPYITSKGNFGTKPFGYIKTLSNVDIPKYFTVPSNVQGINLTDAQIRVIVMQSADGHLIPKSNRIRINVKKERKKVRVLQLLSEANVNYSIVKGTEGYLCVTYPAFMYTKDLTFLYECTTEQLRVVAEECMYWDGCQATQAFSGNDCNSAVIQYAISSTTGKMCNISYDHREYKNGRINTVCTSNINVDTLHFKNNILSEYKTTDGYKYCFTVPSSYFLARRNGKIFPTGNSGKSFMLAALLAKIQIKVLIIAHLSSLIEQLKNEIESATGMTVTVLNAKNKTIGDINVATSQFISQNADVWYQLKHGIGMIVVDEAETAGSKSTLRILQRSYAKYRILISATYSRSVDKRTSALRDVSGHKTIELKATGLLNPTVIQVHCPERFNNPPNKNLYQRAKGVFFSNENIDEKVILVTESSLKKDRQVLIAVDIIEVQNRLKNKLEQLGYKCGIMNGETKAKDRTEMLDAYDKGDVQVLLGQAVLNAGLSVPKISTIIKVSIPSSEEKLEQLIGRARRTFDGKQGAWFIDLQFSGFKAQDTFYNRKAKQENWKFVKTSWDKFSQQLQGG